jgi:Ca2+-binding RTX toxin-like protein
MSRRTWMLIAVAATTFGIAAAPAHATVSCAFTAPTVNVTLGDGDTAAIKRNGSAISVNGTNCGTATVTNTAMIAVAGSAGQNTVVVDLSGGQLAPGLGTEATGTAEIEIELNLSSNPGASPDTVTVQGTTGADTVRLGSGGINLNDDDDADITGQSASPLTSTAAELFTVAGGAGNDTISAAGAVNGALAPVPYPLSVSLDGGASNDVLTGGDGNDTIAGGPGADVESGGDGSDRFDEGPVANGSDDILAEYHDTIDYSARSIDVKVSLNGLADDGQPGAELDNVHDGGWFLFGAGNDTFVDSSGNYVTRNVYGGLGADNLTGGTRYDELYGCGPWNYPQYGVGLCLADGGDTIHGGGGSDDIYGGAGADHLFGDDGYDTFFEDFDAGPNGADDISGGLGAGDTVTYRNRGFAAAYAITLDNVANDGAPGESDNVHDDAENVVGALIGPNTIVGSAAANSLTGGTKADTITGGDGDDQIDGRDGNDTIHGGLGNDTLVGWYGADKLYGDGGDDSLDGSWDGDSLYGGLGNDAERGGTSGNDTFYEDAAANGDDSFETDGGSDTVSYAQRKGAVSVTIDGVANDGDVALGEHDNAPTDIATVVGGSGPDVLVAGSAQVSRTLIGNGGNDTLQGGPGADTLDGGLGADVITGGGSWDKTLYTSRSGRVVVRLDGAANDGADVDNDGIGEEGDNVDTEAVYTGSGNDLLVGSGGANYFDAGAGNDTMDGGAGADVFVGGLGTDTVSYASRAVRVAVTIDGNANDGTDSNFDGVGEEGDNVSATVENVLGGSGRDLLIGSAAANKLTGGPGDDTLDGGIGADTLDGGDGRDQATYASRTDPVSVRLDGSANDGAAGEHDNVLTEDVAGGSGDDVLVGSAGANLLDGGPGDDTLDGGDGSDGLVGGGGVDTVTYASRASRVAVSIDNAANDGSDANSDGIGEEGDNVHSDVENLIGGSGDDLLVGSGAANTIDGGLGADVIKGGAGVDAVDYRMRTGRLAVSLDGTVNDGADADGDKVSSPSEEGDQVDPSIENVLSGSGDDYISGSTEPNTLDGGAGSDSIFGLGGADVILGGLGDDQALDGGAGADLVDGGTGDDTAVYWNRTQSVNVSLDGLPNDGTDANLDGVSEEFDNVKTSVENVTGGNAKDVLHGSASPNVLDGGPGGDILYGDSGAADASDADSLLGGTGADRLYGRAGSDTLNGGAGDDYEDGGGGDDTFDQEAAPNGADTLEGGSGAHDLADYSGRTAQVDVGLEGKADDGDFATNENDNVLNTVEDIDGGSGPDILFGSGTVDNTIDGGPGWDLLSGYEGNDVLNGETGDDELFGGTGNDQLNGDGGNDKLHGDENDDTLDGGAGNDFVDGNDAADVLHGGDGNDELHGGPDDNAACALVDSCPDGKDQLFGDGGDDKLYGGGSGDDLTGGPGTDFENGEEGADTFHADNDPGPDTFDGGTTAAYQLVTDSVIYSGDTQPVIVVANDNIANDGPAGEADNVKDNIENISGGSGDDTITGNGWENNLRGGPGVDHLYSGDGNDFLVGDGGDDFLYGGTGDDTFGGPNLADAGEDTIFGEAGADSFWIQDGAKDTVDGGPDTDTVVTQDSGLDVITNVP